MKRILFIIIPLLLLISCNNNTKKEKNTTPYLIVVSMDGFRWDYPEMYDTPNLDKIASEGVKSEALIPSFPSKTFPNHYTIVTGLYPDNHGIVNNTFYDAATDEIYKISDRPKVENGYFYGGEPIWNTVEKNNMLAASYFWVGSEADIQSKHPSIYKRYNDSDPFESRIDSVCKWLEYPINKRPRLIMLYYHEPDKSGHIYGPKHEKTKEAVEYLDSLMGLLYSKIQKLSIADSINLIITSDHGMSSIDKEKVVILSKRVNTSLIDKALGGNPVYNIKAKHGKIDELYSQLSAIEEITVWKREDIPPHLHYGKNDRVLDMVAVADSSWSLLFKPWSSHDFGGTHGYTPNNTDMHTIFYATGPSFKKNTTIEKFNNVDIYNLMCKVLKIQPSPNDGDTNVIFKSLKK